MYTPEQDSRLEQLRQKVLTEGDLTSAEQKEVLEIIRGGRISASYASSTSKTAKAASKVTVDGAALLAKLKLASRGGA